MIQDEIVPSFKAGMSFSLGGQQYIMSSCVKDDIGMNSSEIECYEVTCLESNEKRCLRTERTQKNKKIGEGFDFIKREADVLIKIQSEQGGLKYFGKGNVMDVNSCFRSCIIVEMPICTLNSLFQDHLEQLELSDRISLSMAAIEAYSVFLKKNITWSEEITFSSVVLLSENRIGIVSGLNTCEIQEKTLGRSSVEMGYTFKKNCAQIKAIALGILSNDKDLASKHATPYNLQQFVGRVISKNKQLTKLAQAYSNFSDIFSDYGLKSFQEFMNFNAQQQDQLDLQKTQNQARINQVNVNTAKIDLPEIINQSKRINAEKNGEKEEEKRQRSQRNQDQNADQVNVRIGDVKKYADKEEDAKGSNYKRENNGSIEGNIEDSMNGGDFILEDLKQPRRELGTKIALDPLDNNSGELNAKEMYVNALDGNKQLQQEQQYQSQQLEQQQQIQNQQMQIELLQTMILNLKSPNQPKGKESSKNMTHSNTFEQRKERAKMLVMQSPVKAQSAELSRKSSLSSQTSNEDNNKSYSSPNRRLLNQKSMYSHEIKRIETLEIKRIETLEISENMKSQQQQYTSNNNNSSNSSNSNYSSNDSNFLSNSNSKDQDKEEVLAKRKKQQILADLSADIFAGITSIREEDEKEHNDSSNRTLSAQLKQVKGGGQQIVLDIFSKKNTLDESNQGQYLPKKPFPLRDKTIIVTLGVILLIIIIFGIVFGIAFNFGISKSTPKTIVCEDTNCSSCPDFADTCAVCQDNYYLSTKNSNYKPTCVHSCTVDNCADCISNYQICEECQDGYTLALSKCVLNSLSCLKTNCQTCKDFECVECAFGYKLDNSQCIKKCASSICLSCDSNDLSKCYSCDTSYTLDTQTNSCV